MSAYSCSLCAEMQLWCLHCTYLLHQILFVCFFCIARSERYHHLASDEDDETNDEESSLEIRRFSSWSNRFSKVGSFCCPHIYNIKKNCFLEQLSHFISCHYYFIYNNCNFLTFLLLFLTFNYPFYFLFWDRHRLPLTSNLRPVHTKLYLFKYEDNSISIHTNALKHSLYYKCAEVLNAFHKKDVFHVRILLLINESWMTHTLVNNRVFLK